MLRHAMSLLMTAALVLCATACSPSRKDDASSAPDLLVGAWESQVHFADGAFAPVGDLRFLYVFNAGGTMTESSNYDAAPPVPPAYGVWRRVQAA